MSMEARTEWADRLAREIAGRPCEKPVDDMDCAEVYICGGICLPCWAKKYIDRYPEPFKAPNERVVNG